MKRILATVLLVTGAATVMAQQPNPIPQAAQPAQISFHFDRPGLAVPKFTLTVNEDGSGRYQADQTFPVQPGATALPDAEPREAQHIDRTIILSLTTTHRLFATARQLNRFNITCASSAKNIADTGTKTLRYTGDGSDGACTYNYSQDKRVAALTDLFQGIAETLDIGRKLDFGHRFDRLGLDATTATLVEEIDSGRAAEPGTIYNTLKSIAQDSELLERVRLRAAKLLRQASPPPEAFRKIDTSNSDKAS